MKSAILVHPRFDAIWPFAADRARQLWENEGEVEFVRLEPADDRSAADMLATPDTVTRLLLLDVPLSMEGVDRLPQLREIAWNEG